MMKKFLLIGMMVLSLGLTACGGSDEEAEEAVETEAVEEEAEEEEAEEAEEEAEEAVSYVGKWNADLLVKDGTQSNVADIYEGEFSVELFDDGTAVAIFDGESGEGTWEEADNGFILDGGQLYELCDDGSVCYEKDGVELYFVKEDGEAAEEEAEEEVEEEAEEGFSFEGKWNADVVVADGKEAPASEVYEEFSVELYEDGTALVVLDDQQAESTWEQTETGFICDGNEFVLQEDGSVCLFKDPAEIYFVR